MASLATKKKGDSGGTTITRPNQPRETANPDGLEVKAVDGKITFNLKGHPWPDVLEWLAKVSGLNLDWQELPKDYLNLVTRRSYTLEEARDIINRHLLNRGYTMLLEGEVLTVVNITKLNPAMVPRVEASDLEKRAPHEFVKVAFKLDWILASKAVEEWKPLLSKNGKLTQMASVNRIEAMDAVINLREVYKMVKENEGDDTKSQVVREFELEHRDVMEVVGKLEVFLGLPRTTQGGAGGNVNVSSRQMTQMIQVLQQINNNTKKNAAAMKGGGGVQLRVLPNERDNTVLVQAPPDKMKTIAELIEALDRPKRRTRAIPEIMDRMRVYRLGTADPQTLVNTLKELGNLDYDTRLQVDTQNKAIIAFASLADHVTITQMVQRVDGSGREFHVIPLRRLEADYVAGTIEFMMGDEDKNKQQSNPYYMRYSYRYGNQQQQSTDKFRIDADVDNNRLLLRCNEMELKEVENLLVKLGEMPSRGTNPNRTRVIDEYSEEEREEILKRIQKAWPQYAPNDLIVPQRTSAKPKKEEAKTPKKRVLDQVEPADKNRDTRTKAKPAKPKKTTTTAAYESSKPKKVVNQSRTDVVSIPAPKTPTRTLLNLLQKQKADEVLAQVSDDEAQEPAADSSGDPEGDPGIDQADSKEDAAGSKQPTEAQKDPFEQFKKSQSTNTSKSAGAPPVSIMRGPDGKLIIRSDDPRALDLLEDMMAEYAPPRTDFKIFKLKNPNTWAYGIELNLEEFFEEEQKSQKGNGRGYSYDPFFGIVRGSSGQSGGGSRCLSKRKPLKFISDRDTHSILVQGATSEQMNTTEQLINLWDKPESEEQRAVRKTRVFAIKYSRAKVIADAIKDVYRDLLSANDKALESKNQQEKSKGGGGGGFGQSYTYIYGGGGGDDEKGAQEAPIKFKGLLSIGVDELSNNLIISASEGLLENITVLVEQLDEAARPTSSVQVVKVHSRLNSALLKKKLHTVFGKKAAPKQNNQPNNQNNNNGRNNQNFQNNNGRVNFNGGR